MGQDLHHRCCLFLQLVQVLIPLLYLLVQCLVLYFELLEIDKVETLGKFLLLLQDLLILGEGISGSEDLESEILKFLGYFGLPFLPLLNLVGLDGLFGATVGGLFGNFPLKLLEGTADVVALGLFLSKFVLKFKGHLVVPILGLLKFDPGLMDLGQDVEVFVFIHGGFICLVDENVVLLAHFLDLGLHHAVVIVQSIVGVLGLADCQL